ncbi:MAG: LamG-like jellyroll fold domain-containing protein, partial [Planctomycetota bacterium]
MKKREDMIKKFLLMLLSAAVVSAAAGPAQADWVQLAKLIASDGAAEDYFGVSVSISGDYAIVGAHQSWGASQPLDNGKAYIFKWDGAGWSQQQKLLASDGAAGDWFGQSVSISGDLAIVGAWGDDDNGSESGSAYMFGWDGTSWVQQQKLLAADGAAGDRFGRSVSLSGDFAIVGAPKDDDKGNNSGSAYIFKWDGTSWVQQQKLLASDGAARDQFGPSVSISGDLAIVGAPGDDDKGKWTGSAYIFKRDGTSWVQQQKLLASDGAAIDFFGTSVSISGDLAIVGADEAGSAYIFKWDGTSWVQQQKLLASDGAAGDGFGVSVSISGDLAIVGAHYDDDKGEWTGSAYIFKRDGTSWVQQQKLLASDGAAGDRFGVSVSISGNLAVVGAYWDDDACPGDIACDSGSAYLLNLPGPISRAYASDLNSDGIVDSADMCIMVDHWGEDYPLCDIGPTPLGDGVVDVQDLIVLAEYLFTYPGAVAYWKLDETEGDIAFDSAAVNDAVVFGGAVWQPEGGHVAGALQLDGIDDYVSTPFVLNPADGAFSVFAWIKGGAPGQVVISQIGGVNWLLADQSGGKLRTSLLSPGDGRSTPQPLISEFIITDGNWHRVGFVWNGSNRILYVDDVEVVKDTQLGLASSEGGLYIGA